MAYLETDSPVNVGSGYNNCGGFMNGDGIWAIILFAMIFGWGNNGYGFFGNRGSGSGIADNYVLATDFANIERKIDGVNNGLCDGFYAMNTGMLNGFNAVQQTLCQGFNGINQGIADTRYAIKDCCCQTQYNMATNFGALNNTLCGLGRDIIDNQNANYRALHDEIVANKIEAKDERIAELTMQLNRADLRASQEAQNAYLLSELKPCPKAAYVVQPSQPVTFPTNCCGNVSYANFGVCGTSVQ